VRLKLTIGAGGEMALPGREIAAAGLSAGAEVEWGALPGLGVAQPPGGGGWIAGTLGAASFADVAQLVASGLHSGALHLALPAEPVPHRKAIFFRDGQVISASSTDPADRLGPVLVRTGRVAAAVVERWSQGIGPGWPLGKILVEQGVLSAGQLYEGLAAQVSEIFLSAFEAASGDFVFRQGPPDERNAVKLPGRTRDLILQGLQRAEAAEQRTAAVAKVTTRPAATPTTPPTAGGASSPVLPSVGPAEQDRIRGAPAEERDAAITMPLMPAMPRAEPVPEPPPPAPAQAVPRGPFEAYRRLLRAIHGPVLRTVPDARRRLDSWFERLPAAQAAFFAGVHFDASGDLDVLRVLANVERSGAFAGPAARAKALEALEGLLAFALFEAKNLLPREDAEALRREVHRIQMGG